MGEGISRDNEGVKYVGYCESDGTFVPRALYCGACGVGKVIPYSLGIFSLRCTNRNCQMDIKTFASEQEMMDYVSQQWKPLEAECRARAQR
jgi:hypothetical protein